MLFTELLPLNSVIMNPNNGNNNPVVATKAISDAANEAPKWSAFVTFLLSDSLNELNFSLIDTFFMVHMQHYEKETCFQPKHKPSDKSSFLRT